MLSHMPVRDAPSYSIRRAQDMLKIANVDCIFQAAISQSDASSTE